MTRYGLIKLLVCDALDIVGRIWGSSFSEEHEQEVAEEEGGENSQGFIPNIVEEAGPSLGFHIEEINIDRVVAVEATNPLKEVMATDATNPTKVVTWRKKEMNTKIKPQHHVNLLC